MGYSLVDDKAQKEALKENAKARKSECYDDECLVDTGKMLAARALISVNVVKKSDKLYKFKARYIDFETGTTTKSKVKYYESKLNDYKALSRFGKDFTILLLGGKVNVVESKKDNKIASQKPIRKEIEKPKEVKKKDYKPFLKKVTKKDNKNKKNIAVLPLVEKRYNGNWDITATLQGGYSHFYKESDNNSDNQFEEDLDFSLKSFGLGLGLSYRWKSWLAFYSDVNIIRGTGTASRDFIDHEHNDNQSTMEISNLTKNSLSINLGAQFLFGVTKGSGLVYYAKTAFSIGKDSFENSLPTGMPEADKNANKQYWNSYVTTGVGLTLEFGLNILFKKNNGIDIYSLIYYAKHTADSLGNDYGYKINHGETVNILFGVRYNVYTF